MPVCLKPGIVSHSTRRHPLLPARNSLCCVIWLGIPLLPFMNFGGVAWQYILSRLFVGPSRHYYPYIWYDNTSGQECLSIEGPPPAYKSNTYNLTLEWPWLWYDPYFCVTLTSFITLTSDKFNWVWVKRSRLSQRYLFNNDIEKKCRLSITWSKSIISVNTSKYLYYNMPWQSVLFATETRKWICNYISSLVIPIIQLINCLLTCNITFLPG